MRLPSLAQLPRPSLSAPSSPKIQSSFFPNGLYSLPDTPKVPNGVAASSVLIDESKIGIVSLLRATDRFSEDEDEDAKSRSSVTFCHQGEKPSMAFADELFRNGLLIPLRPPILKLPPRLQAPGQGTSPPRKDSVSPKFRSPQGLGKGKDFDPFAAALERIRKEDVSLRETFHWRSLERSFERSFGRVYDDAIAESVWGFGHEWGSLEEVVVEKRRRGHNWNLFACFGLDFSG
ncbi:hypothetical protein HPP92_022568 [Vanilla planifolia]|uniref:Uncharacterized protein n=1 Tax=Vanilla planifolia TaxID=51239 RepID=A0A835PQC9_VANPL|nr:hypothetical protein HPP92_022826 [Vanilla planifolia]KAG0459440.1 hypothetical protein HPP92_022568 [Vanilla planifolia]